MAFFRGIYLTLGFVGSLAALPLFLLHPRGRQRIWERYGRWNLSQSGVIWFHGASVGEILGLIPIIQKWRERHPAHCILVTATSATGLERAACCAHHTRLLPFDHPFWIRRALKNMRIEAFVFGETELWPALLEELQRRAVPLILVNGRLSEFSIIASLAHGCGASCETLRRSTPPTRNTRRAL
jgi:3-deoxy-D-manno-octulosonic-acid transferase